MVCLGNWSAEGGGWGGGAFIGADLVEERTHCFSHEVCFRSKRELICVAKWNKSGLALAGAKAEAPGGSGES